MSIVNGFLTLKIKTVHFRLSDLASLERLTLTLWYHPRPVVPLLHTKGPCPSDTAGPGAEPGADQEP